MRRSLLPCILAAFALAACQDSRPLEPVTPTDVVASRSSQAAQSSGVPLHAEVSFGSEEGAVGSPFPPGAHDLSFHAADKVRPRTVVIQRGGSVTYEIYPLHQAAVYEPGIRPEDIDTDEVQPVEFLPPILWPIVDSDGLVVRGPAQSFVTQRWTTPPGTFDEPGRYLVICTTWVHFVEARMYSWVIVQ